MPSAEELLAEEEAARAVEWGTYVATGPIDIGGVRAFNEGQAVPVSHVTNGLVEASQVVQVSAEVPPAEVPPSDDPASAGKVA